MRKSSRALNAFIEHSLSSVNEYLSLAAQYGLEHKYADSANTLNVRIGRLRPAANPDDVDTVARIVEGFIRAITEEITGPDGIISQRIARYDEAEKAKLLQRAASCWTWFPGCCFSPTFWRARQESHLRHQQADGTRMSLLEEGASETQGYGTT